MNFDDSEAIKIIVCGLDNAGKTSMLTILDKIYGFEEIVKFLKPTLGVHYTKREYFGKSIMYWDFGGQEEFRDKYLRNKKYFNKTDMMYYLIDIQDEKRYEESVSYLGQLLEILEDNGDYAKLPIYICCSKADDSVIKDESFNFVDKITMLHHFFNKKYPDLDLHYFHTTIFDIMSIISVHVYSMKNLIPLFSNIEKSLISFSKRNKILRLILSDYTGLPFINYIPEEGFLDLRQFKINQEANYQLQLFRQFENKGIKILEVFDKNDLIKKYFFRFTGKKLSHNVETIENIFDKLFEYEKKVEDQSYYLLLYAPNSEETISKETIDQLVSDIGQNLIL
jgi:GTPase SAR1 family protein